MNNSDESTDHSRSLSCKDGILSLNSEPCSSSDDNSRKELNLGKNSASDHIQEHDLHESVFANHEEEHGHSLNKAMTEKSRITIPSIVLAINCTQHNQTGSEFESQNNLNASSSETSLEVKTASSSSVPENLKEGTSTNKSQISISLECKSQHGRLMVGLHVL